MTRRNPIARTNESPMIVRMPAIARLKENAAKSHEVGQRLREPAAVAFAVSDGRQRSCCVLVYVI